ncbi:hypothetical protein GW17_00060532 [Ensete ventricosum]|nr:hypothetical protein GW17_00060532 [Ensete ventricosum]RZS00614.1 hypothetical protein BHM03_00030367 [Ensete ventricosum]
MLQRANQYIAVEALVGGKREDQKRSYANSSRGPPSGPLRRRMEKAEPAILRLPNTPLTSNRTENFLQIREKGLLKAPNPMKSRPEESGEEEYPDHDDALVIPARMTNARDRQIMVDTGSSIDILYFHTFQKLGMTDGDLIPITSTLIGFTKDAIAFLGVTTLPVTIGEEPRTKTLMVLFMVAKLP